MREAKESITLPPMQFLNVSNSGWEKVDEEEEQPGPVPQRSSWRHLPAYQLASCRLVPSAQPNYARHVHACAYLVHSTPGEGEVGLPGQQPEQHLH